MGESVVSYFDVVPEKTKHFTKTSRWQLVYSVFVIAFVAFWLGVIFACITLNTRPSGRTCTPTDCVENSSKFEMNTTIDKESSKNKNDIQEYANQLITREIKPSKNASQNNDPNKIILLYGDDVWTKYDKWYGYDWRKCSPKYRSCRITTDISRLSESSAVVYNAARMPSHDHVKSRLYHAKAKNVFLSGMTPLATTFNPANYDNFFDFSITYKSESTIRIPYWPNDGLLPAMYRPKPKENTKSLKDGEMSNLIDEMAKYFKRYGKESFMAVTVRNCDSNYYPNLFVKKLQDEGLIYTYAINISKTCLKPLKNTVVLPCKALTTDDCVKHFETFKFVITPDEHICKDYTTRDYWIAIFAWQVVPLVYGAGNYTKHLITNSYIDCVGNEEYISPAFKKAYFVSKDPVKYYKQFHLWRHEDRVERFYWQCELCRELHEEEEILEKIMMSKFWDKHANCGDQLHARELMRLQLVRTAVIR